MIFAWKDSFSEKLLSEGRDLIDYVFDVDRSIDSVYGEVQENGRSYFVKICLSDDFKISSLECSCNKNRCCHMVAVLLENDFQFSRDIMYYELVKDVDEVKLKEFVKNQMLLNDDYSDNFKRTFQLDLIRDDKLPLEDRLYLILDYYDWEELIGDFVTNDLTKYYNDGYHRETFYLISVMFEVLLRRYTFGDESEIAECYLAVENLIKKLSKTEPDLINAFLKECVDKDYHRIYPPFARLYDELSQQ